jgi:uncharacterized membrane protein SpoIIM required for sporulation
LDSSFLRSCLNVVSRRKEAVAILNLLFFGCVFLVAVIAQFVFPHPLISDWSPAIPEIFLGDNWAIMLAEIFFFNLIFSALVVVTLPGIAFFPLSAGFLLFRAVLWGLALYAVPAWMFLAILPTFVLEGEAYVLAAVAGLGLGLSWFRPKYMFKSESYSRSEAFKKAVKECAYMYVSVAVILFAAAVVEAAIIVFF